MRKCRITVDLRSYGVLLAPSPVFQVYGIQAQNIGGAEDFYKELAEQTGGAYVKFTNFNIISDMFMAGQSIT